MKHKSMKAATLAAVLALSMSATGLAGTPAPGGGGGNPPSPSEIAANADTTISILQTASTQPNISYTVPLYVTMAVVDNDDTVKVPTNYAFTNTTPNNADGSQVKIGVTNMSFEKLNTSGGFNTVATEAAIAGDANNIFLQIGGEPMPAINDSSQDKIVSFKPTGNIFWDDTGNKPKPLVNSVPLPIAAKVAKTTRTDTATAAQFRVKYTVSLLDSTSGQALGAVYAGDDRTQAGLGEWTKPSN